jgi:hypothetical protein
MAYRHSAPVFKPLKECSGVGEWRRQRDRLAELFGAEMADKYFVYIDSDPSPPNAEYLNPVSEARELLKFMERHCLTIKQMAEWILVSPEEARIIEEWVDGDLSLLAFTNRMVDFRREVWGEFLLLVEKKGHQHHARTNIRHDRLRDQHHGSVQLRGL